MKILVTGGAGFIGSHLIDSLLKQNHEVICVDNFFSGRKENIVHHFDNSRFKLIMQDISEPFDYKIKSLDRIYNLACPGSPVQYQFDPVKTLNTSVFGVQRMLELARHTGARLLQASTSEIYGDPLEHPQKESYWGNVNPLGERACYDEGKRAAETLCKDYHKQYGVDTRIVRIFNVYGPRMMFNDGRVISNFIFQALLGENITIHGDGKQTRSFCYIDDFIKALTGWMEHEADWQPVNIGNPDERAMADLASLIKTMTGSASNIVHIPYQEVPGRMGDVRQRQADITRLKAEISWLPEIPFDKGLAKTIEDFKKRLERRARVVVFNPYYAPEQGPVEAKVKALMEMMPAWEFDIITARIKKTAAKETHQGRAHIYRVGGGFKLDKFLLPLTGWMQAQKLHRTHHYQVAWAIMASYGALAAALFSFFTKGVSVLLSVYEGDITEKMANQGVLLSPLYKLIFSKAHRWQIVGRINEKERAWLESERQVQVIKEDEGMELLAKRTKEMFQELEILSTRI